MHLEPRYVLLSTMSPKNLATRARESQRVILTTACFISILHCPSCVQTIHDSLSALHPAPEDIVVSIISNSVTVHHSTFLSVADILGSLEPTGFEVHSIFQDDRTVYESKEGSSSDGQTWSCAARSNSSISQWTAIEAAGQDKRNMRKATHLGKCEQCKVEEGGISPVLTALDHKMTPIIAASSKTSFEDDLFAQPKPQEPLDNTEVAHFTASYKATMALSGMTCSSCVSSITHALKSLSSVHTININLLTNSGVVVFAGKHNLKEIKSTIEDCGFEVSVEKLEEVKAITPKSDQLKKQHSDRWQVIYTVGGMTCGSCVGHVTKAIESLSYVDKVEVNLISSNASVVFQGQEHLASIKESIEGAGYTAILDRLSPTDISTDDTTIRTVSIHIDGMFCDHCPGNITRRIREVLGHSVEIEGPPLSLASPVMRVKYHASPPDFTIRQIFDTIIGKFYEQIELNGNTSSFELSLTASRVPNRNQLSFQTISLPSTHHRRTSQGYKFGRKEAGIMPFGCLHCCGHSNIYTRHRLHEFDTSRQPYPPVLHEAIDWKCYTA